MRQAEVQARFLESFTTLYPCLTFRGLRRFPKGAFSPYQFVLRVALGKAGMELDLLCMALTEGFPQEVARAIRRLRRETNGTPLAEDAVSVLIAPHFADEARALCRKAGVGYFDLAGNAGLDTPKAFLEISGKPNPHVRERQLSTPFDGKAERVVRRLLFEPDRQWNIRALAEAAQVSLGLASMVTSWLADAGVLAKRRSSMSLFAPTELLAAWSQNYDVKRSAFCIYRSRVDIAWLEERLIAQRKALGGQYALTLWSGAVHLLSEDPVANRLALYWNGKPEPLLRALRLNNDGGTTQVFVFHPYDDSVLWGAQETSSGIYVVHPLQLYLDLSAGDEEEIALAQRVRERFLPW